MVPNSQNSSFSNKRKPDHVTFKASRILKWLGPEVSKTLVISLSVLMALGNITILSTKTLALPVQSISLSAQVISASQIQLNWNIKNPGTITSVRVYRADAATPQNFIMVASLAAGTSNYLDSVVSSNSSYLYLVRTVAGGGVLMSAPSNTVSVTTSTGPGPLPTPTPTPIPTPSVTPTPIPTPTPNPTPMPTPVPTPSAGGEVLMGRGISETQIELTWQIKANPVKPVTTVRIYRALASEPQNLNFVTSVSVTPNRFVDSGLMPNSTYYYQIKWPVSGVLLSPPSNTVQVKTLGAGGPAPTPTPNATPTPTPVPTPTPNATPTPTPVPTPTPAPTPTPTPLPTPTPGGTNGPIPLDDEEAKLVRLISEYRGTRNLGIIRPSIAMTKSSDFLSHDLAGRGVVSKIDSSGRNVEVRARAFGYQPSTTFDAVVASGNLTAQQVLDVWKASAADRDVLLNPIWKVAGIGRVFAGSTGKWYWVVEFAGFWDKTIPIPGEDEDGRVDGNEMIRTRPPGAAIAAGHHFSGYAEDGIEWYSGLHCDLNDVQDNPRNYCWKDEPPQGNSSLLEPSSPDQLSGTWHVQYSISPTGVVHYNDYSGWDGTGFTITFWINADGTWQTQGYRAYQVPTPRESGTWTSVHDASRNEEIVTFNRPGKPTATIRIHAAHGVLTLFAIDGGSAMNGFLKGVLADSNPNDDPQIILHPGIGYFNAPH